jgi:hypothetical protein
MAGRETQADLVLVARGQRAADGHAIDGAAATAIGQAQPGFQNAVAR